MVDDTQGEAVEILVAYCRANTVSVASLQWNQLREMLPNRTRVVTAIDPRRWHDTPSALSLLSAPLWVGRLVTRLERGALSRGF